MKLTEPAAYRCHRLQTLAQVVLAVRLAAGLELGPRVHRYRFDQQDAQRRLSKPELRRPGLQPARSYREHPPA